MARKKIVAGNWKMNTTLAEAQSLINDIKAGLPSLPDTHKVIVTPPYTHLSLVHEGLKDSVIELAAQNAHQELKGAFTGEISVSVLKEIGVQHVILGHSERREYFGENEELLAQKIQTVLSQGLSVIYCVGEKLESREANTHESVVAEQLSALNGLSAEAMSHIILAYEPVWAIGTGKTATAQQAQDMHQFIRQQIAQTFNQDLADNTTILYGGSCNAQNADELFSMPDVDGGLIGGAALKAPDFLSIIKARIAH